MNIASQEARILRYLQSGRGLTKLDGLRKFGSMNVGGRIFDLREDGWPIKTDMIRVRDGKRVAFYSMKEKGRQG